MMYFSEQWYGGMDKRIKRGADQSTFRFRESTERQRQDGQVGDVRHHGIEFEGWFEPFHLVERAEPPFKFRSRAVQF